MTLQTQIEQAREAQAAVDAQRELEATAAKLPDLVAERERRERQARRQQEVAAALEKATALLSEAGERCANWSRSFNAALATLEALADEMEWTQTPIREARAAVHSVARPGSQLAARLWADAGGRDAALAMPSGTGYSRSLAGRVMFAIKREVRRRALERGERRPTVSVYDPERGL